MNSSFDFSDPSIRSLKNCPKSAAVPETTALAAKQHTLPLNPFCCTDGFCTAAQSSPHPNSTSSFMALQLQKEDDVLSSFGLEQKKKKDDLGRTFHHSSYCTSFYTLTLRTRFLFKGRQMIGFIGINIYLIIMG